MDYVKENDIKKLVQLIDPNNQNAEWLKTLFKDVAKIKESEQGRFLNEMNADTVVALYYPIYNQYFSHDEIKELIRFYSSEVGVKLALNKSGDSSQSFTSDELEEIENFKKTIVGRKYSDLSSKIARQHTESVKKYIDSCK